jgi:hypothetical protein
MPILISHIWLFKCLWKSQGIVINDNLMISNYDTITFITGINMLLCKYLQYMANHRVFEEMFDAKLLYNAVTHETTNIITMFKRRNRQMIWLQRLYNFLKTIIFRHSRIKCTFTINVRTWDQTMKLKRDWVYPRYQQWFFNTIAPPFCILLIMNINVNETRNQNSLKFL